ncbi:TPA: hypothetical protein QCW56_002495 [Bacillus cereus]|nr:hypothetical protein [Bacillus cereus]HDR8047205.1 hypothetical protein [Bacillus cereus]
MEADFIGALDAMRAIKNGLKTMQDWDDIYLVINEEDSIYAICDDPAKFVEGRWDSWGAGHDPAAYANEFKIYQYQHANRVSDVSKYGLYKSVKFTNGKSNYARKEIQVNGAYIVNFWV